jgi:hypothetical protein
MGPGALSLFQPISCESVGTGKAIESITSMLPRLLFGERGCAADTRRATDGLSILRDGFRGNAGEAVAKDGPLPAGSIRSQVASDALSITKRYFTSLFCMRS